jgi:hypothetical protein
MLTKMTEGDWVLVLAVFDACRSRRGDKSLDPRDQLQASGAGVWKSLHGHLKEARAGRRPSAEPQRG